MIWLAIDMADLLCIDVSKSEVDLVKSKCTTTAWDTMFQEEHRVWSRRKRTSSMVVASVITEMGSQSRHPRFQRMRARQGRGGSLCPLTVIWETRDYVRWKARCRRCDDHGPAQAAMTPARMRYLVWKRDVRWSRLCEDAEAV
jgi:hypothetical protein